MRLIDADALRNVFDAMHAIPGSSHFDHLVLLGIKNHIDEAPTIDAVPVVHGRWVFGITLNHEWMKCSECLVSQTPNGCFTYCPNCGAKMDLKEE